MRKPVVAWSLISAMLILSVLGCSESVDSLVASSDAAISRGDYRTASLQLKSALQQDPTNARARWLLGEVYLALEQAADAEKEIRRAREAGVGDDAVLPALAQALLLQNRPDEVLALAEPAGLIREARSELMAAKGLAHLVKGEAKQADELTSEALGLAPASKLAVTARVRVLANAKRFDEAEQLLNTLLRAEPDYGTAWSLMGDIEDVRGDLAKAEQAYTTAIEKRPVPYGDLLKRAQLRLREQNLDGALADAEQLTRVLPNLPRAWYVRGAVQFLKKDFATAQDSLDRAYQLDGNHLPTVILLGLVNLNLGNLNQAAARAERSMVLAPNVIAVRLLMATVQLQQQAPEQAENTLRPVVAAQPDNLHAKKLLIASLQMQGKGTEAVLLLDEIAAANPDSIDLQTAVGLELVRMREPEKALPVLARVVEQAPADSRVNEARVSALVQGKKFDEALAAARQFQEQNPADPLALQALGVAQAAKGELIAAAASFRQALTIAPGDPAVSLMLARLLQVEGDLAAAAMVVAQAAETHPENAGLPTSLAVLQLQQGKSSEAIELLRKTLRQHPSYRSAQLLLAKELLAQDDAAGALAVLPANGAGNNDPVLLSLRGEAHLVSGNVAAARDDLERLTRLVPKSAQAHFKLGLAYAALGDREGQDKALDDAASLDPQNVQIGLARSSSLATRGEFEEALVLARGLGLDDSDPRLLRTELLIAQAAGEQEERVRLAQRLQTVAPSAQHVLLLAQAQYAQGQAEAAEATLRRWLEQHPGADDIAMQLAALYGRTGRAAEAVSVLRPLAEKYPDNAAVLNNLAWYLRDSAPGEALAFAEKAAALAADTPTVLETYATVLALNGRYEEALLAIGTAIQKATEPAYFRLQRVEILADSGDAAAAMIELEGIKSAGVSGALQGRVDALTERLARQ